MPGLLHHNAMPEDREEMPANARNTRRAGGASASAPPARGADACSHLSELAPEHAWEDIAGGGRRCTQCGLITYPQRRLF